jgi:Cell wall-active antibiotics response 4TMS YvqF
LSILLILVAFVIAGAFLGGDWGGPVLIILAIVAVVMLLRRDKTSAPTPPVEPPPGNPMAATPPDSAATEPGTATAVTQPVPTATTQQIPGSPPPPVWHAAPAEPPRPRERSPLFRLVMSAMLVVLGSLALVDIAGADIAGGTYLASALAVVGLGLLVGARWGRSRGLIAVGVILALALPLAAAVDQFSRFHGGSKGRVAVQATTIPQGTGSYEYGAGEVTYDLTRLDFANRSEELNIDMGAGSVQVLVPPEVDLQVNATVGVGELKILDRQPNGGFGVETSVVDNGTDGPGGGRLKLNLDSGFGEVVVSRAAA